MTSAKYISEKCGKVTISVTNNQMPLMPLFAPVYTSTRPYSQTRSSVQRDLMQPDEVLRLDQKKCIALFQGRKPALLYKLTPEELPDYAGLRSCQVKDYIPEWNRRENEKKADSDKTPFPPPTPKTSQPAQEEKPPVPEKEVHPAEDLEYSIDNMPQVPTGGLGMLDMSAVRGDDDTDEDNDSPSGQ